MIVYKQSNGYGDMDIHAPEFQLGRELYDTQVMVSRIMKARAAGLDFADVDMAEIERLLIAHCRLISLVGHLRADYDVLKSCLHEPGRYEYVADGRTPEAVK